MERRMLLLNSVLLRQNPHNVQEWHKRVQLYEGKPQEVISAVSFLGICSATLKSYVIVHFADY